MASPSTRDKFDREREFEVVKPFWFRGEKYTPGRPFPKQAVNTRRLRQMYEQRYVTMTDASHVPMSQQELRPNFDALPDPAIISWLTDQGQVPRFGLTHEQLVEKATAHWEKMRAHRIDPKTRDELLSIKKFFGLQRRILELTGIRPANKDHALKIIEAYSV